MKTGSSIIRPLTRGSSARSKTIGCPGRKAGDSLVIDCSGCDGPQDFMEIDCLRGCIRTVSMVGEIDHITLSRDVVIEYRGWSVATLYKLAAPLGSCRPSTIAISRRCLKCPIEPSKLFDRICSNWPPMPPPETFRVPSPKGGGDRCLMCRNRTLASMEASRKEFSELILQMNKIPVKVIGGRR